MQRDWQAEIDRWTERFGNEPRPPAAFARALREGWTPEARARLAAQAEAHRAEVDGLLGQLEEGGCEFVRLDLADDDCSVCEPFGGRAFALGEHPDVPTRPPMPFCPACRHRLNLLTPYFLSSLGLTMDDVTADTVLRDEQEPA